MLQFVIGKSLTNVFIDWISRIIESWNWAVPFIWCRHCNRESDLHIEICSCEWSPEQPLLVRMCVYRLWVLDISEMRKNKNGEVPTREDWNLMLIFLSVIHAFMMSWNLLFLFISFILSRPLFLILLSSTIRSSYKYFSDLYIFLPN